MFTYPLYLNYSIFGSFIMTINASLIFLTCSVISCIFFTLGRLVGRIDIEGDKGNIQRNKITIHKSDNIEKSRESSPRIIDVEYEDIIDLSQYREERESETRDLVNDITRFELMYSKRDGKYVKVPRDIAEFIRYMRGENS